MKEYRFGIVGCGMISAFHAASIHDLPNARLVAGADSVAEKANEFGAKHGCDVHTDFNEMVQRNDIDIVCVCTPSGAHMEPAVAAAAAGKHVIVEKPLEINIKRCDAILRAAEENNVQVCGIFPFRFTPGAMALKKAVTDGRFGRITVGDAYNKWFRSQEYYDSGAWRGTWNLDGGGAIMNQAVHAVDLVRWYMGDPQTVFAFTACLTHERIEVEDTAVAAVRYASGAMGVIECATSVYPGEARRIEILGERGTVIMEKELFVKWEFDEERPEDAGIRESLGVNAEFKGAAADPKDISHENFREEIKEFLKALESGASQPVGGAEARKAVELIEAIYRSARAGEPVTLPL